MITLHDFFWRNPFSPPYRDELIKCRPKVYQLPVFVSIPILRSLNYFIIQIFFVISRTSNVWQFLNTNIIILFLSTSLAENHRIKISIRCGILLQILQSIHILWMNFQTFVVFRNEGSSKISKEKAAEWYFNV